MPFTLKCTTSDAWPVAIAGNTPALGQWDPQKAMKMQSQGSPNAAADGQMPHPHQWVANLEVEQGQTIEYKFVKLTPDGPIWEEGPNRLFTRVPGPTAVTDSFRHRS